MTAPMDLLALAAVANAVRKELGRLEENWMARSRFFGGEVLEIPLPVRPMTGDPNDPDRDHQMWLRLQLIPVSGVVDRFIESRDR